MITDSKISGLKIVPDLLNDFLNTRVILSKILRITFIFRPKFPSDDLEIDCLDNLKVCMGI